MALPIILFFTLIAIAGVLMYLGTRSNIIFNGALLLSLGGVLIIITGIMLMSSGLDLQTTASITDNGNGTFTITNQVLPNTDPVVSALSQLLTYGGFIPIALALVFTILHFTQSWNRSKDEWRI